MLEGQRALRERIHDMRFLRRARAVRWSECLRCHRELPKSLRPDDVETCAACERETEGMALLRRSCAEWGLPDDYPDLLWDAFSDPKSPTCGNVEATIRAVVADRIKRP